MGRRSRRRGTVSSSAGPDFSLPEEFWTAFAKENRNRSPLRLERPFAAPLVSPEEVYRAVASASDRFKVNPLKGPMGFFIENAMVHGEPRPYLPGSEDTSLERYVARVAGILGGRRFALRLGEYASFDEATWFRLRDFLRPYFDVVGIPASRTHVALFLGDYAQTPFGIHRDFHETFVFVVSGRKRFRAWPGGYFAEGSSITGSLTYDAYLGDGTTLEGGPGDVLYWPSDHWHVGESVDGLNISLSLAVTPDSGRPMRMLMRAWDDAGERLEASGRSAGPLLHPGRLQAGANRVSKSVESVGASLRDLVDGETLQDSVKSAWLDRATSLGIEGAPPPLPWRTLKDGDLLRADPRYPVLSLPAGNDRMICSANGHSFSIAAHPGIRTMLGELNRGRACRVGDLIERYSGSVRAGGVEIEALPEGIRDVLEKLASLRAVTIV